MQVIALSGVLFVMALNITPDNIVPTQAEQSDIEIWMYLGLDDQ